MPAVTSAAEGMSTGAASGSEDSGTSAPTATRAAAASGTLIQNTPAHDQAATSSPPSTGPAAIATAATAAQAANAFGRPEGAKTCTRIASVAGMTSAAPTPIAARPATSQPVAGASAAAAEAAANSASPTSSTRRRPNRSPAAPKATSSPAKTTT
ncbi:hypothetical protein GCM10027440_06940 [Nocardiopsis coralliicola]